VRGVVIGAARGVGVARLSRSMFLSKIDNGVFGAGALTKGDIFEFGG
jgi:hypothetical protein